MRWIFIAGSNNTFTTILRNALLDHDGICGWRKEGQVSKHMPRANNGRAYASFEKDYDRLRNLPEVDIPKLKRHWLSRYAGKKYNMEKSPPNSIRIPWLNKNFVTEEGNPVFLIPFKNPYAVIEGIKRHRGDYSMDTCAKHYKTICETVLSDVEDLNEGQYKFIFYKDYVLDTKNTLDDITDFLGLKHINFGVKYDKNRVKRSIKALSSDQINTINDYWSEAYDILGYSKIE